MLIPKCFLFFFILYFSAYRLQAQQIYIVGANIINVKDGKVYKNRTVIIEDSVIKKLVQNNSKIKIPGAATVINAEGKYVMPGLIDAHIHFFNPVVYIQDLMF